MSDINPFVMILIPFIIEFCVAFSLSFLYCVLNKIFTGTPVAESFQEVKNPFRVKL